MSNKPTHCKIFLSDSFNPHLNLATEEWIFHDLDPSSQVLFLWRNQETVVIGRNQNPWSECNLKAMQADKVFLARRTTGGGAVFHDLGNTNFTFLSPKDGYKRDNNAKIILNALKKFSIQGEISGRNDLLMAYEDGPRKFSGSAFREKQDRAFHHGTLLINADLSRLGNYLTPNPKKLKAKGKESVRARVANLTEASPGLDHNMVAQAVIESFEDFYQCKAEVENLSMSKLQEIPSLKAQYEQLSSWDWLYGKTLEFTHQMSEYLSLGLFDFHFKFDEGHIVSLNIYSDCLYPQLIDDLSKMLNGKVYSGSHVAEVIDDLKLRYIDLSSELTELSNWLKSQIEV